MRRLSIPLLFIWILPLGLLAEITVTARFNPPRIALGDRAQYLVEIRETRSDSYPQMERVTSLPIPQSGGLQLQNGRTSSSQQTSIMNGRAEYTVTQSLIIDASATAVGNYTIPAYTFEYKGQRFEANAATLQVLPRSADAGPTREELIFLKAELPSELYVGQQIAFELKLYVEEQVSLNGLNRFERSADGYTISELPDERSEGIEIVEGRRYRVLTWPMTLAPIQTGPQNISFEFGLSARLPERNNRRSNDPFGRGAFGRSMFDDFFGRTEQINVYTDAIAIDVKPLPIEGRPDSFSGAVGRFAIEVTSDAETSSVGEPIMLSLELTGQGNFERIDGPEFEDSPLWRSYDPESNFEASDTLGLEGSKRFDYVMIPQVAGELPLPEVEFSFFDPQRKEYITLESPSIPVQVSQGSLSTNVAPPTKAQVKASEPELELSRSLTTDEALYTLDYQQAKSRDVAKKIFNDPVFMGKNLLAFLAVTIAAFFFHHRKKNSNDPLYLLKRESRTKSKVAFRNAIAAQKSENTSEFLKEAQVAIRLAATARAGTDFSATSDANRLVQQLPSNLQESPVAEDLRALFEAADAYRFGGLKNTDTQSMATKLEKIIKAL